MSIRQLRTALHNRIDQIDESFLRVMFVMTETYLKEQEDAGIASKINQISQEESWKPISEEELISRLEESSAQYKSGQYKDLGDVEKDSEKW